MENEIDINELVYAANELIDYLDEIESFEVEAGMAGEGPLVKLCRALKRDVPPNFQEWFEEEGHADYDFG